MYDSVGQQLGNYYLVRLLGRGGFSNVYLGEHIYLKTQAAIKVLQMQLEDDEKDHFLHEARTIAHLVHPHIIRVLDFGVQNGLPFLVMDYAPQGTLRERHPNGTRLPLATIVEYVKQVALALQYARALKPVLFVFLLFPLAITDRPASAGPARYDPETKTTRFTYTYAAV